MSLVQIESEIHELVNRINGLIEKIEQFEKRDTAIARKIVESEEFQKLLSKLEPLTTKVMRGGTEYEVTITDAYGGEWLVKKKDGVYTLYSIEWYYDEKVDDEVPRYIEVNTHDLVKFLKAVFEYLQKKVEDLKTSIRYAIEDLMDLQKQLQQLNI